MDLRYEEHAIRLARLKWFKDQQHKNRFWWFREADYLPRVFDELDGSQWKVMTAWYDETEQAGKIGECNIPAIELILGFLYGNNISRVVQLGHFAGWSTLLIGWALQRMGRNNALVSFDINAMATKFTDKYIGYANLEDVVMTHTNSSTDFQAPGQAADWLHGSPEVIFIDSSHNEGETIAELKWWWDYLVPGGVIFLHDVSLFAQRYEKKGGGGVHEGVLKWSETKWSFNNFILLNEWVEESTPRPMVYDDGCGLGIIQKGIS